MEVGQGFYRHEGGVERHARGRKRCGAGRQGGVT